MNELKNRTALITGGTGSFGKTMLNHLLENGVSQVRVLSRDEEKQDALRQRLNDTRVEFRIGDIRDYDSVERAMVGVQYVFHAAALKQVPSCEFFPMQSVLTNINGSNNVIKASIKEGVRSLVCLSTDKAVAPISAMGISKAMMEKLAASAARELGSDHQTTISCVRYGNVMCSRGSVIPLLVDQVKSGKPVTVTVPEMTRFLMPLSQSVELVDFAFANASQGDLFVRKAPAASIADLVQAVKNCLKAPNHQVEIIGWRHSEKLFETLATAQELNNAVDMDQYWRLLPDDRSLNYKKYFSEGSDIPHEREDFHSHNALRLSVSEVESLLMSIPEFTDYAFDSQVG